MLKIKILQNVFEKDNFRVIEIDAGQGITIADLKAKTGLSDRFFFTEKKGFRDTSIVHNDQEIFCLENVEEGTFWGAVLFWVYWSLVAIATIYSIYSYITMKKPSTPNYGNGDGLDDGSPTYGWDGIQTTSDVAIPIPVVYGEHRVGGNIINAYVQNDGDKNYLNILLGLCEGEISGISDIKLNDQPIANFENITVYSDRLGTNNDTVIPNFENLYTNYSVGQGLNAINDNYVYTSDGSDIEGFEVQLDFPAGIFMQNEGNGQIESWSVGVKIEYKEHSAGSYTTFIDTTISGKQRTDMKRYYRKEGLTPGQYDIKVTRTTAGGDFYHTGDLAFSYAIEIRTDDIAYNNVAKLGIKALATNQISGSTPQVSCLVKGKLVSVPAVMYDGDPIDYDDFYWDATAEEFKRFSDDAVCTWDGSTYADRWSANPVWCIRDLLTNARYGIGEQIAEASISKAEWVELAKYCDERVSDGLGGWEKRFRLDVVLDTEGRAVDSIMQLLATFRGIMFYSQNLIKITIDKPSSPVQLFGSGNIIAGSLNQQFKPLREFFNTIEVQYLDKDNDFKQELLTIIDEDAIEAGDPIRKKSTRLFTTRKSQALREARYLLLVSKYMNRSISFRAGIDAIACQPGDLISVSHDLPQWGFSGRVIAGSTTTSIVVDRDLIVESGKTYKIRVKFADDTTEEQTVTNVPGTYTTITVGTAFTQAPASYDVFAFGEAVSIKKDFRIVTMKRNGDMNCDISALEYDARIYDTDTIVLPAINSSALSFSAPPVNSLALTEQLVRLGDGTIETAIDVWFRKPDVNSIYVFYKSAKIYLSDDGGNSWVYQGETTGNYFQIKGGLIDGTPYTVRVVSLNQHDQAGSFDDAPEQDITLLGKSIPPSNVTSFILNQSRDRLVFSWAGVSDLDLFGYEIRTGDSWEAGVIIATQLKNTRYVENNFKEGNAQKYFIKAIDTSGNYSTTATEATVTIDNIPFTNIIEQWQEQTGWAGTKTDVSKVGDNLEIDAGELSGTYVTAVRDVGYVANFKIGISSVVVDATGNDAEWDDDADATFADSETRRFSGEEAVGNVAIEIKTSEDNITWSDWRAWQSGDYKCRYFQLRITLSRSDTSKVIQLSELNYYADLPDVDENQDATVAVAGTGAVITFNKEFHEEPALNVTILSGTGVYWLASSISTTGVTIKLYDITGTAVTGTLRLHIHGV